MPAHLIAQQVLDLGVDAAKVVGRPALEFFEQTGRQSNQKCLACFGHDIRLELVVQRARIDDRRRFTGTAENHEQITDHRCPALFIELDDGLLF